MKQKVSQVFKINAGEGRLVGLTMLQSFLIGVPRLFTFAVGSSLFLSHFDSGYVPVVYAANAVALSLIGVCFLKLETRIAYEALLKSATVLLAVVLAVLWLLTAFAPGRISSLVTFIWVDAEWTLTNIVFWGGANTFFTVRQGKRLFGLIGNGEVVALVVGGLLTPVFVGWVGTHNLLLFSLAGVVGAYVNLITMYKVFKPEADQETRAQMAQAVPTRSKAPWFTPFFVTIFATISLQFFSYYIVDNTFLRALDTRYESSGHMASFLGVFFAGLGFTTIILKSFVSSRFIARYALLGGLAAPPALLAVTAVSIVLVGYTGIGVALIFWLVVATKLTERVATESFYRPSYYLLFQPMRPHERSAGQTRAELIVSPVASGLIALILLFLNRVLHVSMAGLALSLFPVIALRIWYARRAHAQYRAALTGMLSKRGLNAVELNLSDSATVEVIANRMMKGSPHEVLYCLDLLGEAQYPKLEPAMLALTKHDDVLVRRRAFRKIQYLESPTCYAALSERVPLENDPEALGSLLRALAASSPAQATELLLRYADDGRREVRIGALIALGKYCGHEELPRVTYILTALIASTSNEDRYVAACILAEVRHPDLSLPLETLLRDEDDGVCIQALRAAVLVDDETLWPLVFEKVKIHSLRSHAIRALKQPNTCASRVLIEMCRSGEQDLHDELTLLHLIGKMRGEEVAEFLLEQLFAGNEHVRTEVAHALCLMEYKARSRAEEERIRDLIENEQELCARVQCAMGDIHSDDMLELTHNALEYDLEKARRRLLYVLSFLYPTDAITRVIDNYFAHHADSTAFAIELLDNTLSKDMKGNLLPLFESGGQSEDLDPIARRFKLQKIGRDARIVDLVTSSNWSNPWMHTCAVHEGETHRSMDDSHLDALVNRNDRFYLREVVARLTEEGAYEQLLTIEKVKILRQVGIFREVPDEALADIAGRFEERYVEAGTPFIRKGEMSDSLFIVVSGSATVHDGEHELALIKSGDIVGELAALDPEPRTATVTALDDVHLFSVDSDHLYQLLSERIEVTRGFIDVLCQRLRTTVAQSKAKGQSGIERSDEDAVTRAEASAIDPAEALSLIDKIISLRTCGIFKGSPDAILSAVATELEERVLSADEQLFEKGAIETTLFIIVSGGVKVHDGDHRIATLGRGDVIGELAALSAEARTASVTAESEVRLLSLERNVLYELMWDRSEIARGILQELVRRLRAMASN